MRKLRLANHSRRNCEFANLQMLQTTLQAWKLLCNRKIVRQVGLRLEACAYRYRNRSTCHARRAICKICKFANSHIDLLGMVGMRNHSPGELHCWREGLPRRRLVDATRPSDRRGAKDGETDRANQKPRPRILMGREACSGKKVMPDPADRAATHRSSTAGPNAQ